MNKLLLLAGFALATGTCAQAGTIADWTFETSQPAAAATTGAFGSIAPEVGSGTASAFHAGASVYSSPAGNGSAHSFSSTLWAVGDYYQFQFSTLGLTSIQLSYDQTSSATGPGKFLLEYSTDGTTFTPVTGTDYTSPVNGAPNGAWSSSTPVPADTVTEDLSSLIGNDPTVYLRFVDDSTTSANGGTVATAGTDRMDNIILTGNVPEQTSTLALLGLGVVGLGFSRRLKK